MSDESWWVDASELDDEQTDVVSLPPDQDYLVVGPPGSGKTNLLLLRASYLAASHYPNVMVLMFTRSLREFVVRGTGHYSVAADKIQTIFKWAQDLLGQHGRRIDRTGKAFDELRLEHAQELKKLFDDKPLLAHHLDCLLVDEVQDCLPEEIELFFRAAKRVFFVGDHRQEIYETNGILDSLAHRLERKELSKHYRNGEEICKFADAIGKNFGEPPLIGSCNYDETKAKSSVTFDACKDEADLFARLSSRIAQQLKAYPDELIGVACPKNDDASKIRAALTTSTLVSNHLLGEKSLHNPLAPEERVVVCTMHDAKGLEFRAVHLPFAEHVSRMRDIQKRLAFTSATRAKTSLSVYSLKPLPGYLEQARDGLSAKRPVPAVSDLFAGKKKRP